MCRYVCLSPECPTLHTDSCQVCDWACGPCCFMSTQHAGNRVRQWCPWAEEARMPGKPNKCSPTRGGCSPWSPGLTWPGFLGSIDQIQVFYSNRDPDTSQVLAHRTPWGSCRAASLPDHGYQAGPYTNTKHFYFFNHKQPMVKMNFSAWNTSFFFFFLKMIFDNLMSTGALFSLTCHRNCVEEMEKTEKN